jgi:hypothetical protein
VSIQVLRAMARFEEDPRDILNTRQNTHKNKKSIIHFKTSNPYYSFQNVKSVSFISKRQNCIIHFKTSKIYHAFHNVTSTVTCKLGSPTWPIHLHWSLVCQQRAVWGRRDGRRWGYELSDCLSMSSPQSGALRW